MLKTIIIKELQNHLYSLRFIFALVLTLFLFGIASVSFIVEFKDQKAIHQENLTRISENMKNVANNASRFAQNMNVFPFAPRNSAFMSSGQEDVMPNTIIYTAFNVYGYSIAEGSNNPFVLPSRNINWEFIVMLLFSFLAIIFTFDTVSGEKEMRTLALGMSNSVSRGVILTGKYLGAVTILSLFIVLGIIVSLLMLSISGQVVINGVTMAEIAGFVVMSVLLIACMAALGLLASVLTNNPNTSLLIGLMIWLILLYIIPHTTLLLSNKLFPVESSQVIDENTGNSRKVIEASFPDGKWHSEGGNPFEPDHQIRANMQMAFMQGEKEIRDAWYQDQFSQYVKTSRLTCVSPMFAFEMANERLLDGGFQRFSKNWDDLHTHQAQFLEWFKTFDAKDKNSPHWLNPYEDYSTSKQAINIGEVPVYTEKIVPMNRRLTQSGVYIALLLGYAAILFFVSFTIFIRYDVR